MEINKNYTNELTVGINFFENIPPVRIKNDLSQYKISSEVPYVTNNIENRQTRQGNLEPNKTKNKTVVNGFGATALFTAGLLMTSKQSGERIRLDEGLRKHKRLHNSEDICKRNPTNVRKYYNEDAIEADENISCKTKEDEEISIPSEFREDILASDYHAKRGNLKKILEVAIK
ncbi:MAG: hypothetical protein M3114_08780, partial [Thermoproteota archaeon]|nr:hypothetical protein [Thermoproteota archaeon]